MSPRLHHRNAALELTSRKATFRAGSYSEKDRSFEATISTEAPTAVRDYESWQIIDEVLVARGGEFPDHMPLLDDHDRYGSLSVIGSARDFRQVDGGWTGRAYFADPDDGDDKRMRAIEGRVRDGHIRDVSIGYVPIEWVDIPAGQSQDVNGRKYAAGNRTLRVTTKWRAHELSITPIGADSNAKIRSHQGQASARIPRSDSMNPRLIAFLRSLGLAKDATKEQAREFLRSLRGVNRSLANLLDYDEADQQARTTCDLGIRSLGFDPKDPSTQLELEPVQGRNTATAVQDPPSDGEPTPAAKRTKPTGGDGATTERSAAEIERHRISRINEFARMAGVDDDVRQRAIDDEWDMETVQDHFLRLHRERNRADIPADVPAQHSRNSVTGFDRNALIAAMQLRNGVSDPTQRWISVNPQRESIATTDRSSDPEIERAADRGYELSTLSMIEVARRCLAVDGIQCEPTVESIRHALELNTRATTSMATLSTVFTTSYLAMMLEGFEATPDSTEGWTVSRDVPNYLQNERNRMGKMGALQKRASSGTAEDMTFDDLQEVYKIFEYAGKFTIDEQDFINDSFGVLNEYTPQEMGEAAKQLRPDLVYGTLAANAAMRDSTALFHADHGNLKTSAALAAATLKAAITAMVIQQEGGRNLNIMPEYLIVPATLEFTASELLQSAAVVYGGTTAIPAYNSLKDKKLKLIVDSRLDNGVTNPATGTAHAGSTTTWYLSARGSRHTIEVGYLRGRNRMPRIRSSVLDKGQFGICFDVQHSLGAKPLDWRGMVKNTG